MLSAPSDDQFDVFGVRGCFEETDGLRVRRALHSTTIYLHYLQGEKIFLLFLIIAEMPWMVRGKYSHPVKMLSFSKKGVRLI